MRARQTFLVVLPLILSVPAHAGLVSRSIDKRWSRGLDGRHHVRYYIHTSLQHACQAAGACACPASGACDHGVALGEAIQDWESSTPIEFDVITTPPLANDPANFLYYIDCDAGPSHTWGVKDYNDPTVLVDRWGDPPGTQVTLKQAVDACDPTVGPALQYRSGGPDDMFITIQPGKTLENDGTGTARHVPQHETGHAVGLSHENKRTDGSSVVNFYAACVAGDPAAFSPANMSSMRILTRYDVGSLMHYPSETKCLGGAPCTCYALLSPPTSCASPVTMPMPGGVSQTGCLIHPPGDFTHEDLNAIYQMYPPRLGDNHPDDRFGATSAAGDFNGDGYDDLAVGAPGDEADAAAAGAVYLFRGTYDGLTPWRRLTSTDREAGDDFGAALVAGDLDGDGRAELVVGAPGARPAAGEPRAGAVWVYRGAKEGPLASDLLHQENVPGFTGSRNDDGERFGGALAVGNFDGTALDEIAIGATGDGAGGRVYVVRRSGTGTAWTYSRFDRMGDNRQAGDLFGAALAAGDLDGDVADDLIVGSPETGTTSGAGHVYVFRQGGPSGFPAELPVAQPSSPASHDRFGEAVAFGRFASGGGPALAVGAPGRSAQRGLLWRLVLAFGPTGLSVAEAQSIDAAQAGLVAAAGNEFGQVLAVGEFYGDSRQHLAVGVPRYGAQAGKVVLLRNNGASLASWQIRSEPTTHRGARSS